MYEFRCESWRFLLGSISSRLACPKQNRAPLVADCSLLPAMRIAAILEGPNQILEWALPFPVSVHLVSAHPSGCVGRQAHFPGLLLRKLAHICPHLPAPGPFKTCIRVRAVPKQPLLSSGSKDQTEGRCWNKRKAAALVIALLF